MHQFRCPANDGQPASDFSEGHVGRPLPDVFPRTQTQQRRIALGGCAMAATETARRIGGRYRPNPTPGRYVVYAVIALLSTAAWAYDPESLVSDCVHNRLSGVPHPCPTSWRWSTSVTGPPCANASDASSVGRQTRRLPVRPGHRPSATGQQAKEAARRRGRKTKWHLTCYWSYHRRTVEAQVRP